MLITLIIFTQLISSKQIGKTIKSSFKRLTFQDITGNYKDTQYLNSHSIQQSDFVSSSTDDKEGYPLSNIFNDDKKYWVSRYANNETFQSSIFINFTEPVLLEAFLYGAAYRSGKLTREYDGFPINLKIYTALNDEDQLSLHTIFTGTPIYPMMNVQFVFEEPVHCKRVQIQFSEVTSDFSFSKGESNAVMRYLKLLKSFGYDNLTYGVLNGNNANSDYVNFHKISPTRFTYSSTGDRENHPLSLSFDNALKNSFWVSEKENSENFRASIFVNFTDQILLESFQIAAAYRTPNDRFYDGYPTVLGLYVSKSYDDELKLHSMFYGNPTGKNDYFQFVLTKPVYCSRLQLEFIDVTPDESFSNKKKNAVTAEILFLESFENIGKEIEIAQGFYTDDEYLNSRKITIEEFDKYYSTGDRNNFPIQNAFDEKKSSYWVAKEANNDTFINSIYVSFKEPKMIEAILYDSSYSTSGTTRTFQGFPIRFNVYTALNENDEFVLNSAFYGTPVYPLERAQFVLQKPVNCTRIKLEFAKVTKNKRCSNQEVPEVANFIFIQYLGYDYIEYKINNGYLESHVVPYNKFNYSSTGDRENHPISLAFDGKIPNSYWVSEKLNSDTFHSSIFVNFTEPILLEGFLIFAAYKTIGTDREYHGYPLLLNVKTAIEIDKPLKKIATFSGNPTGINDNFLFELNNPIVCTKLQLEFVDVTPDNSFSSGEKAAVTAEIKILADMKNYSKEIKTDDWQTLHVNKNFAQEKISNLDFEKIKLVDDDEDYLFVIEDKNMNFEDVNFTCKQITTSAIRTDEVPQVTVKKCTFDSCQVKNNQIDGGAIYSKNCGFKCESSNFNNCITKVDGNGGGIYFIIENKKIEDEVSFENCQFSECKASKGAGIFILCNDEDKMITINHCIFLSNSLFESESSSGSGIYLNAANSVISHCSFKKNTGGCSCKIVEPEKTNSIEIKKSETSSVSLFECEFEINEKSDSSLSYSSSSSDNKYHSVKVKNCIFTGKPSYGSHHIKTDFISIKKIHINFCKFSSNMKQSMNFKFVDLNTQIFNYDEDEKLKSESVKNIHKNLLKIMGLLIGVMVAAAIVIILSIKVRRPNENANVDNNNQRNLAHEQI